MQTTRDTFRRRAPWGARAFSLAELLVVIGIIALLIAILLPPLQAAHRQAKDTKCAAQQQQLNIALEAARADYGYFPVWDDAGSPTRYTWIDVLVQRKLMGNPRLGYCPQDPRPSPLNAARGRHHQVAYPGQDGKFGIDYSYGISVPLAAAGWIWQPGFSGSTVDQPRRLDDHERYPAQRILVADGNWSTIYNLSGDAAAGHDWAYPTQYDNTVDWRHRKRSANLLFQDGHVGRAEYLGGQKPVDTHRQFLWYPGESVYVGPDNKHGNNWYPNAAPVNFETGETAVNFPGAMAPSWYTNNLGWTQIYNK